MNTHSRSAVEHSEGLEPFREPSAEAARGGVFDPANEQINILLVDDEPKNLEVLESVLENPLSAHSRRNADQALTRTGNRGVWATNLGYSDAGHDRLRIGPNDQACKKTADIPIIFLTAYFSDDQHVLEGYESGAVDYLHKPINPAILRSKVAVFADLHLKSREIERTNLALLTEIAEHRCAETSSAVLRRTLSKGSRRERLNCSRRMPP